MLTPANAPHVAVGLLVQPVLGRVPRGVHVPLGVGRDGPAAVEAGPLADQVPLRLEPVPGAYKSGYIR
jgi:hypothetical protein